MILRESLQYAPHRIIKRFAWLPITVDDETRWLETVYIYQSVSRGFGQPKWQYQDSFFTTESAYRELTDPPRRYTGYTCPTCGECCLGTCIGG